jgi:hypothetical protein
MDEATNYVNLVVTNCWNVDGALQFPIIITQLTKVPYIIVKAIFQTSFSIHVCSYASDISALIDMALLPHYSRSYLDPEME